MKINKIICNKCGNEFEDTCENAFGVIHQFGYGCKYDGDVLSFDLCSSCTEVFVDELVEKFAINPLTSE